jgi:dihydrodipicolinate synthase/N-acetylneuraminate lyase
MSFPNQKHHGVIVPIITPFTPNGDIDAAAVGRIVSHCAENGVAVFALGTTGEAASISTRKRARLIKLVVETAAHRVKVYAGIGDNCTEHSIGAANEYLQLGADAVVAHLPSYYNLRPAEMKAYFELLASQVKGAMILYNIPSTTHMSLPLDIVESLSHLPNIVGFKDSENVTGRGRNRAPDGGTPGFFDFYGCCGALRQSAKTRVRRPRTKLGKS